MISGALICFIINTVFFCHDLPPKALVLRSTHFIQEPSSISYMKGFVNPFTSPMREFSLILVNLSHFIQENSG